MTAPSDHIVVRGAREHNLAGVDIDIPKRQLVVFTGVSGSGKSSLVFDTVAAESQRLINETYTAFLQSFMASPPRPDVDSLRNLSAAIVVDQERMGANVRSTVGTATDAYTLLRIIFSRSGQPRVGPASLFSFNDPRGMCPRCEALGRVSSVDLNALLDRDQSLAEGAITFPGFDVDSWQTKIYLDSGFFDPDKPIRRYTEAELHQLLHGEKTKVATGGINLTYEGLMDRLERLYLSKDIDSLQPHIRRAVERIATFDACPECEGSRLNAAARAVTLAGHRIGECAVMQISDLTDVIAEIDDAAVGPLVTSLSATLHNLVEIGLGYLSLNRESGTLSGGEAQRVKMVRHLDSALTDLTYVFDEPTIGLHAHDIARMITLLRRLRDKGNTVLVVEHDPDVIAAADHVVDLGPGAGTQGGRIVYQGSVEGLWQSDTTTGRHLHRRQPVKDAVRTPTGQLPIEKGRLHNLDDVTV